MALDSGTRLGPYEIIALIGAGGMGEVYRARDTKLNRDVALKILPDTFSAEPDRLARFRREAQVLASLNHPNIAAIHGFEDSGSTHALVLELVEGLTLADRIAKGPIPLDEALPIAKQIAEALEAAHEQGIIHRDLKPANIKLRDDGTVKVLDFGLAKALEPASAVSPMMTASPTITTPAQMTGIGMILGTAAYMAPEQAKGRPADKRSDVWAFGCVLYEMLTGKLAFEGEDVSDTLAAVLRADPDWSAVPPPPSITRLLRRTLEKDRRRRLADIADARIEIEDTLAAPAWADQAAPQRLRSSQSSIVAWVICGVALVSTIATAFVAWNRAPTATPLPAVRFTIAPPDGWKVGFDFNGAGAVSLPIAVSPDGRRLAIVLVNGDGRRRLWIRSLDSLAARIVDGADGATAPFWSPDSRFVAFYADGRLKKIDIAGGPAVSLCSTPTFNSGTWSNKGVIVFGRTGGSDAGGGPLLKVSQEGGTISPITTLAPGERLHVRPHFLPDGDHFIFRATADNGGGTFIGSLSSTDRQKLFPNNTSNVNYSRGHVLFVRDGTLMAQPFDAKRLTLPGEAIPIADQILTNGLAVTVGSFSASDAGVLAYQTGASATIGTQLVWLDRSGKTIGLVGERRNMTDLELSPDGKLAAISVPRAGNDLPDVQRDVWLVDLVRGVPSRFTFQAGSAQTSVFSPDGSRLVFNAMNRGVRDLFQKSLAAGREDPLLTDGVSKSPTSWSPDERYIVYVNLAEAGKQPSNLWVLPLKGGDRKPFRFLPSEYLQQMGRFSPTGRWIAFASDESDRRQVWIASFPDPSRKYQVSKDGGTEPRWRGDGKELYFVNRETLFAVDVDSQTNNDLRIGVPKALFQFRATGIPRSNYAPRADGQQFLFNTRIDEGTSTPITIVVNWDTRQQ